MEVFIAAVLGVLFGSLLTIVVYTVVKVLAFLAKGGPFGK